MDGLVAGHDIGVELALGLLGHVREAAARMGMAFAAVVADRSGNPVASCRMDGAPLGAYAIAADKAYSSALWQAPTRSFAEPSLPGNGDWGFANSTGGRLIVFAGGLPITVDGALVGALGVSGGTSDEDEECALAGLRAAGLA